MTGINEMLYAMHRKGASDLHLVVPSPPTVRVNGQLEPLNGMVSISAQEVTDLFSEITSAESRQTFIQQNELDFAYVVPGLARFRVNASRQRGTISLVFRLISEVVPTIEELGLPQVCRSLIVRPRGLVLITGPTGSGKSTTLAAMIEFLNSSETRRVVTLEDPIEYIFTDKKCIISQREVGTDTNSFALALRHVLRQNPDVIMVGEMRDGETAAAALTAAETGHLVLTTGHAPSADQAIERVIDLFPPYQQSQMRAQLASVLEGVLCQVLIPRKGAKGRVPAVEVMLANAAVRNLIREGRNFQLPNAMRTGLEVGMQTLDRALANLCRDGVIEKKDALVKCRDITELEHLLADG